MQYKDKDGRNIEDKGQYTRIKKLNDIGIKFEDICLF